MRKKNCCTCRRTDEVAIAIGAIATFIKMEALEFSTASGSNRHTCLKNLAKRLTALQSPGSLAHQLLEYLAADCLGEDLPQTGEELKLLQVLVGDGLEVKWAGYDNAFEPPLNESQNIGDGNAREVSVLTLGDGSIHIFVD